MAPPTERCAEIVKLYYKTGSPKTVIREMQKLYPHEEKLTRQQIHRTVKRFEVTGSVTDARHHNTGRPRSSRCAGNIQQIEEIIESTPQTSIRKVLGNITNRPSKASVQRILKFDLKLIPYKMSVMQHLKDTDIEARLRFADWVKLNDGLIKHVWFSDEAHFYLNGQINKQNCRFWGKEKPDIYLEKPLHGDKVTVWAALSSDGIIGPFFYENEDGDTVTVNSERYIKLMKSKFLPTLRRRGIDVFNRTEPHHTPLIV